MPALWVHVSVVRPRTDFEPWTTSATTGVKALTRASTTSVSWPGRRLCGRPNGKGSSRPWPACSPATGSHGSTSVRVRLVRAYLPVLFASTRSGTTAATPASVAASTAVPVLDDAALRASADRFAVVTAIEVLEHVLDPVTVSRAHRVGVAPEGLLFVTTGNAARHGWLGRWRYVAPDIHVSYYEPRTLELLYRTVGLVPVRVGYGAGEHEDPSLPGAEGAGPQPPGPLATARSVGSRRPAGRRQGGPHGAAGCSAASTAGRSGAGAVRRIDVTRNRTSATSHVSGSRKSRTFFPWRSRDRR